MSAIIKKYFDKLVQWLNQSHYGAQNETKARVQTAVVGISLLLFLLTWGGYIGASFVAAALTSLMCWEFAQVFYSLHDKNEKTKVLLASAWLLVFATVLSSRVSLEIFVVSILGFFTYFLVSANLHENNLKQHFLEFIYTIFILSYPVLFMTFLPILRKGPTGLHWVILFLSINWTADSVAYFVGKKFGKRRLYPIISPKKSVEGLVGGILGAIIISLIYKFVFYKSLSVFGAVFTAVVISFFAAVGDLCESFYKRAFDLKDSGAILPGHGGVLDRFDGVLFTLPFAYICQRFFS